MTRLLPAARPADTDVPGAGPDLSARLLDLADADADALADGLHDGVLQALVVARYAADLAVRGGDAAFARDAVQEALVALRRAVHDLRPRGDQGLAQALADLAVPRADGTVPLLLEVDETAAEALSPRAAGVAHRLVQRALAGRTTPLAVRVTRTDDAVLVALDGPVADAPAEALRALPVDGRLTAGPDGAVLRLPLPRPSTEEAP